MTSDPIRLLDDPSAASALRGDLAQATDVTLDGLDLEAGLDQLRAATAATPPAAASGSSLTAKVGLGAAVTTAAVALWLGQSPSDDSVATRERAAPVTVQASAPGAESPRVEPTPSEDRGAPVASPRSSSDSPSSAVAPPSPLEGPEPVVDDQQPPPEEPEAPAARSGRSARRAPQGAKPSAVDDVLREARMVASARKSLAGDPQRALRLAEQAETEFPEGQLVEERRAIAIRALAAAGRMDEARDRAEAFLARYGRGAHAQAVRRAIAVP